MIAWIRRKLAERAKRLHEESVLAKCGCVCWCDCGAILQEDGFVLRSNDEVHYRCEKCGEVSRWLFDAPVPIRIRSVGAEIRKLEEASNRG